MGVKLIVYDFDGVMTDNMAWILPDGSEAVRVHRGDGWAIDVFRRRGIEQAILTSEGNPIVDLRAKKLGIPVVRHGYDDKGIALGKYCVAKQISLSQTAFVGNDLNDLSALRMVEWPICSADAAVAVKAVCRYITRVPGGQGVIRELLDVFGKDWS